VAAPVSVWLPVSPCGEVGEISAQVFALAALALAVGFDLFEKLVRARLFLVAKLFQFYGIAGGNGVGRVFECVFYRFRRAGREHGQDEVTLGEKVASFFFLDPMLPGGVLLFPRRFGLLFLLYAYRVEALALLLGEQGYLLAAPSINAV